MTERKTLKEWRQRSDLTVEEVADRLGIPLATVRRWEEVGFDWSPQTRMGDETESRVLEKLHSVLELNPEDVFFTHAPSRPDPGDLVMAPTADHFDPDFLIQNAKALNLRMVVPTRWGPAIKPFESLAQEDFRALANYREAEADYHFDRAERLKAYERLVEEHEQASDGDELTVGEALEREDEGLEWSLNEMSGRDAAFGPGETPDAEGESGPPSHYPTFENPDVLVSWDGSRAAWAYLAQLELRDDCLITAASRLYPHVEDWGLVSRLMEFAGWGDSEDLERFIGENLEAIEARLRAAE